MNQHPAYELFEELGRGINTVVYRSYDLALGREVAIKELDETGRRDPRHRERFLREAQFLAQFEHDNVLRVYSVDTERGWIVMELMKGTLASTIAAGPSDPDLVRSVLKQTLDALAFLHEKNKVHGTVRPTNLLINDAGRVKLSEFEQTNAGGELRAPKGSKKYLAPELIRPEFGDFGPPLDLYCLGFTALELLKGPQFESLFPGTGKGAIDADIAWLRWHSSPDELPSTRKLVKGIPDDLAHVLDHMLKKRVADRPQSAQEVLKELADRPLVAVPIAGATDDAAAPAADDRGLAPGIVRTLATPNPTVLPRGSSPAVAAASGPAPSAHQASSTAKAVRSSKGSAAKPAAPTFSKDWFNQQLSRPYVLYPLCALILLGAFWFSFMRGSGKNDPAKKLVAVTFDVQPDDSGLQVVEKEVPIAATKTGKYAFLPGPHAVTFRKDGYEPLTQEIAVAADKNRFSIKLQPILKFNDVTVQVTPPNAQLKIGEAAQSLVDGATTHKLQEGQPLVVEASLDGFGPESRTFTTEDLAKLGYKVTIELEPEKPRLPASLVAKPGATIDPDTQLPVRALAATLAEDQPLELALVKPGSYKFGSPRDTRLDSELPDRSVKIEQPFYIAINETTNDHYQRFSEAAGESKAGNRWQRAARKWAEPLELDPVKNQLPVTNVSAEQAEAFCQWLGGRLPTEIEWEIAVRGLDDKGYPLPWGKDEPTREHCRIFLFSAPQLGPVPVAELTAGASPLGLINTIGNAAEWCRDSEKSGSFILRGQSFTAANTDDLRVTWRGEGDARGEESIGFRVVIPVTDAAAPSTASPAATRAQIGAASPSPFWMLTFVPWDSISRAVGVPQ